MSTSDAPLFLTPSSYERKNQTASSGYCIPGSVDLRLVAATWILPLDPIEFYKVTVRMLQLRKNSCCLFKIVVPQLKSHFSNPRLHLQASSQCQRGGRALRLSLQLANSVQVFAEFGPKRLLSMDSASLFITSNTKTVSYTKPACNRGSAYRTDRRRYIEPVQLAQYGRLRRPQPSQNAAGRDCHTIAGSLADGSYASWVHGDSRRNTVASYPTVTGVSV